MNYVSQMRIEDKHYLYGKNWVISIKIKTRKKLKQVFYCNKNMVARYPKFKRCL